MKTEEILNNIKTRQHQKKMGAKHSIVTREHIQQLIDIIVLGGKNVSEGLKEALEGILDYNEIQQILTDINSYNIGKKG